ncbi:MAG: methionyl-tRNA formyltransferase, partial [Anaerolineae bacterium]
RRDSALLDALRNLKPDVLVLAAYGQILRPNVLELAPGGCIGVHASLLPRWRGAAPVAAAIWHGDKETGITLMLTDAGMDTGPIIAQRSIPIAADDTTFTLTGKLAHLGADLLIETLPDWLAGKIVPQPQDNSLATQAPPLTHEQGRLDFSLAGAALERQVRALNPWPGAWTTFGGQQLKVLQTAVVDSAASTSPPGTVVALGSQVAVVSCEGLLILLTVQLAGKRALPAEEFMRGRRDFIGTRLGEG